MSDNTLQNIAKENNLLRQLLRLERTAITIYVGLLPGGEIDLCGHATLATAFVLFQFKEKKLKILPLQHKVANLWLLRKAEYYELNFPVYSMHQVPVTS